MGKAKGEIENFMNVLCFDTYTVHKSFALYALCFTLIKFIRRLAFRE